MQRTEPLAGAVETRDTGWGESEGVGHLLTRRKMWIGGLAVFAGVGYLVSTALGGTTVYYLTVAELRALPASRRGEPVRVAGHVAPGTIVRPGGGGPLRFAITDDAPEPHNQMGIGGAALATSQAAGTQHVAPLPVVYEGLVPDVFNDNIEVVVQGQYTGEQFEATMLLAKCPSKFEASTTAQ